MEQQIIKQTALWIEVIKVAGQVIASATPLVLGYWIWKRKRRKHD